MALENTSSVACIVEKTVKKITDTVRLLLLSLRECKDELRIVPCSLIVWLSVSTSSQATKICILFPFYVIDFSFSSDGKRV